MNIPNCGIASPSHHGLSIREDAKGILVITRSSILDIQNNTTNFTIFQEP